MRTWTITTYATARPRDIELHLYDDALSMKAAANKWALEAGTGENFDYAEGICHGFEPTWVDDDGVQHEDNLVCLIRLHTKRLQPEVVAHEVAHAAQHLYRLDAMDGTEMLADYMHAANETFAWILGEVFGAVWSAVTSDSSL